MMAITKMRLFTGLRCDFPLLPPPTLRECRHCGVARRRVAVRSTNCSCSRHPTPFARQVAASRAPHLRMRFLWTGYLLAPRGLWPRLLSLGTYPPVRHIRRTPARRSGSFGAARRLAIRNRVRRHRAGAMGDAESKKAPASLYRGFKVLISR